MLLLFFHLPPLLLALPLSCSRSSPAVLVEVEAATDGAEPHKQPLYYNYSKSVKTAQKGALWDTRALQRKYLWVGDPPRAAPYEPTLTGTRAEQVRVGEHGRGEEVFLCHQTLWGLNSGQERERERETSAWAVAGRDARGRYWSLLSTSSDLLPVHSMQVQFTAFPHFPKFLILEMFGFALSWIRVMRLHLKWHLMYFGASWSYIHTVSWSRAAQTTCRHLLTTFWPLLSIFSFLMSLIMSINPRLLTISRRQTHFPHHLPNINWCVSCFKERRALLCGLQHIKSCCRVLEYPAVVLPLCLQIMLNCMKIIQPVDHYFWNV